MKFSLSTSIAICLLATQAVAIPMPPPNLGPQNNHRRVDRQTEMPARQARMEELRQTQENTAHRSGSSSGFMPMGGMNQRQRPFTASSIYNTDTWGQDDHNDADNERHDFSEQCNPRADCMNAMSSLWDFWEAGKEILEILHKYCRKAGILRKRDIENGLPEDDLMEFCVLADRIEDLMEE
ncbi:hypothetical protein BJ508DRAFT_358454 [Ascobolus immersus RN42]|uniref:Uncharacterized protein n=1 Tax=Ascobolus immersus RN42 TaxID=1160509 RepID=A0A3N4INS1_ASCIM|nr:hypothetical protein BJ508DRAFT_358454 [Ascobolus immersus RN42]